MFTGAIIAAIWGWVQTTFMAFWGWIAVGAAGVLAFLFSPTLRKYTIGAIAVFVLLVMTFLYGYNSNHQVEITTHTCDEFRSHLVSGPATDKAINIFKRNGLCV